jgi:hypothetical protein
VKPTLDTEILISKNNHIERRKGRSGYVVVTVFSGADLMLFHKIPKWDRPNIENKIVLAIEHEIVHLTLDLVLGLTEASHTLDNVIPQVYDIERLLKQKLPSHVSTFNPKWRR